MELMNMAAHLSLSFSATVTGPHVIDNGDGRMVHVLLPDGNGVGITEYAGSAPLPSGPLNVWGIRDTGRRDGDDNVITEWCVSSVALPNGVEYHATFERIRDVLTVMSGRTPTR